MSPPLWNDRQSMLRKSRRGVPQKESTDGRTGYGDGGLPLFKREAESRKKKKKFAKKVIVLAKSASL
ncbi:hypothetical protein CEXT_53461 [Caerostris extrusa]|uniref:Uncharacterized protein n=1 Tax=Caerostris extrusa TaxID=172846 RepID=A0AAV4UR09_CAEEX|nr:hypothetical protein CEXT_53461 [Caerostris extrusa]